VTILISLIHFLILLQLEVFEIEPSLLISIIPWWHHRNWFLYLLVSGFDVEFLALFVILLRKVRVSTHMQFLSIHMRNLIFLLDWTLNVIKHREWIEVESWDSFYRCLTTHSHCQGWLNLNIYIVYCVLFVRLKTLVVKVCLILYYVRLLIWLIIKNHLFLLGVFPHWLILGISSCAFIDRHIYFKGAWTHFRKLIRHRTTWFLWRLIKNCRSFELYFFAAIGY